MIIKMVNEFKLTVFILHAQSRSRSVHATWPLGRHGPWDAGRWALGPLSRRGPWSAGLLLAKPCPH